MSITGQNDSEGIVESGFEEGVVFLLRRIGKSVLRTTGVLLPPIPLPTSKTSPFSYSFLLYPSRSSSVSTNLR